MSETLLCPELVSLLNLVNWVPVTGRGQWVVLGIHGAGIEAARAAGFEVESVSGLAAIDFASPKNAEALEAMVRYVNNEPRNYP